MYCNAHKLEKNKLDKCIWICIDASEQKAKHFCYCITWVVCYSQHCISSSKIKFWKTQSKYGMWSQGRQVMLFFSPCLWCVKPSEGWTNIAGYMLQRGAWWNQRGYFLQSESAGKTLKRIWRLKGLLKHSFLLSFSLIMHLFGGKRNRKPFRLLTEFVGLWGLQINLCCLEIFCFYGGGQNI